jgi:hypothetical protein
MSKSDNSGGFMVFKSTPTPRHLLACGPTEVALDGTAGTTYLIMAFSDTKKNGGNLVLSLEQGPPPPTISATIDATGTVLPKGKAEISGTFTCTKADFAEVDGQLRQIWHRVKITAFFSKIEPGLCDGHVHDWSRIVTSHNGTYAAGDATVRIDASACGLLDCEDAVVRQHVTLSKGGRDSISHDAFSSGTLRPVAPLTSRQWPTAA